MKQSFWFKKSKHCYLNLIVMTKKVLTYSFVFAAALASCTDGLENFQTANVEGGKGKLVDAGLLAVNRGSEEGTSTRAFSPKGDFEWMPTELETETGAILNNSNQRIGLCWTGVNTKTPDYGSQATPSTNVYTNYEYEHVGWVKKGVDSLEWNECTGVLLNGAYIVDKGAPVAKYDGTGNLFEANTRWTKYHYGAKKQGESYGLTLDDEELNLGAGIFKTNNASVFEGQYVVYFPYTDKFTKGAIVANVPDHFDISKDAGHDRYETASKYAFCAGYINHYAGGSRSESFKTKNLSPFVKIDMKNVREDNDAVGMPVTHNIKSVIVYSGSEILYEYGIDAASVIEASKAGDMSKVKKVEGKDKSTNAIYANFSQGDNDYYPLSFIHGETQELCVLPVLPQQLDKIKVIIVNDVDKTMEFNFGAQDWKAGQPTILTCKFADKAFAPNYYAVDEPSFASTVNKAEANEGGTITLLRPISMETKNDDRYNKFQNITAKGELTIIADNSVKNPVITLTAGTTRYINCVNPSTPGVTTTLTVKVPVVVEGYGCCSDFPAKLNIGGVILGAGDPDPDNVTFTELFTNYGTTTVGIASTNCHVKFANVVNTWDEAYVRSQIGKGGEYYTKGSYGREKYDKSAKFNIINELTTESTVSMDKLTNDGVVTIKSTAAKAIADARGNRSLKVDIQSVENTGKLKKEVTKATAEGDIVGGQITISKYALATVAENIVNKDIWSYISVDGEGDSDHNDGRLDVKSAGTSTNAGTIENDGVINLLGGSLDNSKGIFLDNLTGQVGGIAVFNGERWENAAATPDDYSIRYYKGVEGLNDYQTDLNDGIYVSKTNTNERMAFILTDAVESKSCNVIEVLGVDGEGYDLSKDIYGGKDLAGYDLRVNANGGKELAGSDLRVKASAEIKFLGNHKDASGKYDSKKCYGHCAEAYSNMTLGRADELSFQNNLFVRKNNTFKAHDNISTVAVGKNVYVETGATLNAVAVGAGCVATGEKAVSVVHDIINDGTVTTANPRKLIVGNDIKNNKNIITDDAFEVGNDFIIAAGATLDSNGTNNTVTNNFELTGESAFAKQTTTTIGKVFNSYDGSKFTREGLTGSVYRATVNVGTLGKTEGNAIGGWPTQM